MSLFDKINKGTYTLQPTDLDAVTWTNSPTGSTWGQSNNEITFANMTGSTEVMYYDIGTANISDNQWILRFKLDIDSWSQGTTASSDWVIFGLSSTTGNSDTSQDSMVGVIRNNSSSQSLAITRTNGTTLNSQLGSTDLEVLGATGSFYVEMIRTSDANYTLNVRSGSHSGTLLGSQDYTNASGVGGLRYIKAMNHLTSNTNADASGSFGEIEFYNGVTSVTNVFPQRVVENFTGYALDTDRWTTNNNSGTNTFAMSDEVDGGFKITTQAVSSAHGSITFDNIRQYAHNGSECIGVLKRNTGSVRSYMGLSNNANATSTAFQMATVEDRTALSNKAVSSSNGSSFTQTQSSTAIDTAWTGYKLALDGTDIKLYINGVLGVTKSTTNPTVNMQPIVGARNESSTAGETQVRYMECYNT